MRILHVLEPDSGGVPSYVRELARLQRAAGHDVHVVGPAGIAGRIEGELRTWTFARRRPSTWLPSVRLLRRHVEDIRPDVVHLHSFFAGAVGRVRRLPGAATVYQPHSWAFGAVGRWARPLVWVVEAWGARATDQLVVNSSGELAEGERWRVAPRGAAVVGVPIDTDHFRPGESQARAETAQILCVGRICRQKNQAGLAAEWERRPLAGARLVFLGAGDTAPVEQAAPSTFGSSLLCLPSVEDVRAELWRSAVCVVPSRYEGQSVAMAEALACGVPVVSTAVNGSDVLSEGDPACGAVVPVGDMTALLDEVAVLLSSPDLDEVAGSARRQALEHFDADVVRSRVIAAYENAVARHDTH